MNLQKTLILFLIVLILSGHLIGQDKTHDSKTQESTEIELIRETLTDYIEGSTNGQPDRLRKAFHPDLNLYSIKNGAVSVWSGKDYIKDTKVGQPTGETGKIISIDFENNTAVAKIEISHPNSKQPYVDYFMLLKTKGKWTIIHKMFTRKTSEPEQDGTLNTQFDKFINALMETNRIPGCAVAVVKNGRVIHRAYYGISDKDNEAPVNEKTLFRVFSLSKIFVATAIMKMVDEEKLSMETSIGELLEELPVRWRKIQVRHLLSHSSGLPDIRDYSEFPEKKAMQKVYRDPIKSRVGTVFDYNQTNFWLLQRILCKVSGKSFEDCMWETQFGEKSSSVAFCSNFHEEIKNRSKNFFPEIEGVQPPPPQNYDYLHACNGINLTLDEFVEWNSRFDKGKLISKNAVNLMWGKFEFETPFPFSHGWLIHEDGDERVSYGFSGSGVTVFRKFPKQDLSIIFLGNGFETFFNIESVVNDLAQIAVSQDGRQKPVDTENKKVK